MRIVDLAISLPMILIALLVGVLVGPSLANIVVIIGLVLWSQFARMARNETLRICQLAYIDLARAAGSSPFRIVVEHIVPNIAGPLIVLATLQIGAVIIMEASLSFLGVGVPPPAPAWGTMIAEGRSYVVSAWWICIFPGAAVMLAVVVANLLGDGLTEALDPARRARRGA
jgi:peptide/nickel transport system permease protein